MSQETTLVRKSLIVSGGIIAVLAVVTASLELGNKASDEQAPIVGDSHQLSGQETHIELSKETLVSGSPEILAYKSQYGNLPDSLQGTMMRESLQVDDQGNLRISSDIRRVFDYFLSTIEEEELEVILARIDEYLNYYLKEPALSQSKQILTDYIALKQALYDFETERSDSLKELIDSGRLVADRTLYLKLLQDQLTAQSDLRAKHLDPDVYEAFYASEEAYDEYSLSRLVVESEPRLSAEEKASRLAQIDAQAPQEIVDSRREASITDDLKQKVESIKESGGGQEEIRALRVEMFGEEAAERFDTLDREREQWQSRLDNFLSQRQDILQMEGLSLEERQYQVDQLRESQFDSLEQIRVKVYERKADV